MSLDDRTRAELEALLSKTCEGQTTAKEHSRLESLVLSNPAACELYIRYMQLHGALLLETTPLRGVLPVSDVASDAPNPQSGAAANFPAPSPRPPVLGFLRHMLRIGGESPVAAALTWMVMAIFLSGTLLTAVFIGMMILGANPQIGQPPINQPGVAKSREQRAGSTISKGDTAAGIAHGSDLPAPGSSPVARLIRVVDCDWENRSAAPNTGDDISPGRKLALKSGLAEIIFQGGARTLLEGPATLEIRSRMGVYLQQGKFTVTVENPLARGFEVLAPGMKYTDLGTEFGVFVAANGEQEVQVFRGNVRAEEVTDESSGTGDVGPAPAPEGDQSASGSDSSHPPSPSSRKAPAVLSANQGLHVAAPDPSGKKPKQVERIAANEKQFVRSLTGAFPLFSTGVNLDRGTDDPHWEIIAISTDPKFMPRHAVVAVPAKSYLPDARDKAQWIADAKTPSTMQKGCRWTLRTRFDLSAYDPATASIEGKVAVDNYLIEMRLNGKKVPLPSVRASEWFARRVPLKIESGFTSGVNTLEIVIENADSGEDYNPMGICLDWRGAATRTTKLDATGATSNEHR